MILLLDWLPRFSYYITDSWHREEIDPYISQAYLHVSEYKKLNLNSALLVSHPELLTMTPPTHVRKSLPSNTHTHKFGSYEDTVPTFQFYFGRFVFQRNKEIC